MIRCRSTRTFCAVILAAGSLWLCPLHCLRAAHDEGRASLHPWSGYWWPHRSGGLTAPLEKYDRVTGQHAADWEGANHVSTNPAPKDWFGHCHAWAAAAVSEQEPTDKRQVDQVDFQVGDLKGLLTAVHAQDVANSYGHRFDPGDSREEFADLAPDELWRLLQTYVRQQHIPLILDMEAGEQVWNYPVYEYQVDYEPETGNVVAGTMQLVVASNNVDPNYVGTEPALHRFTFRVEMRDGAVVMGSGEWTGESVEDHPDFAWYPYVAVAENPYVNVEEIARIVGDAVGGSNAPSERPEPSEPTTLANGNADVEPVAPPTAETVHVALAPADDAASPNSAGPSEGAPPETTRDLLSPDELAALVTDKTSHFFLDVQVDRGDGGAYTSGEPVQVSVVMRDLEKKGIRSGYLYLFDVDPRGDLQLVYPTPGASNAIETDQVLHLPVGKDQGLFLAGLKGQHDLKAVVVLQPMRITGFSQASSAQSAEQQAATSSTGDASHPATETAQSPSRSQSTTVRQIRSAPRTMVVHPRSRQRLRHRFSLFRKGDPIVGAAPEKIGPFAQDMCSYRVMDITQ